MNGNQHENQFENHFEHQFNEMTAILNFGLGSQNHLADLNKLVSERIRQSDQTSLQECFQKLLSVAGDLDVKKLTEKECFLDELESEITKMRMELLKEANLMQALRFTNDAYLSQLQDEIAMAKEALKGILPGNPEDARVRADTLKKRTDELVTTKTVAESFSAQIKLSEDNYFSMADRTWNVLMHVLPLLRGQMTAERSKLMTAELKKLMRENS